MTARVGNITFDCDDVLKMATFWSAVLGRPIDVGSSRVFASIGGADPTRRTPAWYFSKVPEPRGLRTEFTSIWWTRTLRPSTSLCGSAPSSPPSTKFQAEVIAGP